MEIRIPRQEERDLVIDLTVESADKFLAPYKEELSNMMRPKNGSPYDAINKRVEELKKFNSPIPEYVPVDMEGKYMRYGYIYVYDLSEDHEPDLPTDGFDGMISVVTDTNGKEIYRSVDSFFNEKTFARLVSLLDQRNFDFFIHYTHTEYWRIRTVKCIVNTNSSRANPKEVSFGVHSVLKDLQALKEREYCEAIYDAIEKQMKELRELKESKEPKKSK